MKLIELSYPIDEMMPRYPNAPMEKFTPRSRMEKGDRTNSTIIEHFLHNGTHVDAPFHMDVTGVTIDKIPLSDFSFAKPMVLKTEIGKGGLVKPEHLKVPLKRLKKADLLLFYTGYSACRGNNPKAYADDFPGLSVELAELIRIELPGVRAVAIDTLSIENPASGRQTDHSVHKALLSCETYSQRPVLIFEDVNIEPVLGRNVKKISAFPLRLTGLEASPVSMIAETLNYL